MTTTQLHISNERGLKSKKIIQVLSFYPPHLGGMEQRVSDLSERLAKDGHEVHVVTSDQGTYAHMEVKGKLKISYLKSRFFANTVFIPSLFGLLMKQPKDAVIHTHIAQVLTPEVAFIVAKMRKQPLVVHIRGDAGPSTAKGKILLPIYKKYFLKNILLRADRVIVLTEDYASMINQRYGVAKEKISVIPNASNFTIEKLGKRQISGKPKLLLVGRLSVQKNIELAIRVVALLKQDGVFVNLVLVGDGELHNKLVLLAKTLNIEDQVIFRGRLEHKELKAAYLESDIVIQPSFDEGFSSVLLEAMSSGRAVIAGDILGTRSIIKDGYNGLLIDPHAAETLVEAIKRLINDPVLHETLVQNGMKEIRKYNWDKIVKSTEKVYSEVSKL
jgi:glycosyltransferase involved in cell wall biosynthesis